MPILSFTVGINNQYGETDISMHQDLEGAKKWAREKMLRYLLMPECASMNYGQLEEEFRANGGTVVISAVME